MFGGWQIKLQKVSTHFSPRKCSSEWELKCNAFWIRNMRNLMVSSNFMVAYNLFSEHLQNYIFIFYSFLSFVFIIWLFHYTSILHATRCIFSCNITEQHVLHRHCWHAVLCLDTCFTNSALIPGLLNSEAVRSANWTFCKPTACTYVLSSNFPVVA